ILAPNTRGYDTDEVKIIEAISRFRAGGYDERIGFTVYDAVRYRETLQPLVEEEVSVLLERLVGEVDVDRAEEIIAAGTEPLRELIGAIHSKLLLDELRRATARRGRDAADDEIARRVAAAARPRGLRVVTSDAELARRVREHGADVVPAGRFRREL